MSTLTVTFWGVRGSIPVPGPETMKYGGNTACLELKSDAGDWIVFDAGTGLRVLGESLDLSKNYTVNMCISHPHWDHINGFPFFPVIFIPGNTVNVYGPGTFEKSLEEIIKGQMQYSYFPVRTEELRATLHFYEITNNQFSVGNFKVYTHLLNHPVTCYGYKVVYNEKIFVYLGDNEPYYNVYKDNDPEVIAFAKQMNEQLVDFVKGAHVLVSDAQYIPAEYPKKTGWGHSTTHHVINLALKAKVKTLFLFHHEPLRKDSELDAIVTHYRNILQKKGLPLDLYAAAERNSYTF
ncbi:MAG: MBL fold metallo-hydrolase [Spirochaetes bacterium]|jgi:phosphoribosyl 1,2-cyclic phosphodiesterase|nr:MBL fold metallo-hydrolase [Spirochaetota bacterium]